ncbi:MAG: Fic family protein [Micrococcaceae bacterium]|nr:Fic family protein [Micrococcaceae bacterium]
MVSNNAAHDPYLMSPDYPVLRNLVGANTYEELSKAEADLFHARVVQLNDHSLVAPTRDAQELRGLHRHLFQDVYDWAGEFRVIDMRLGDGDHFAPYISIPLGISNLMNDLAEQDFLKGLQRDAFVDRLAKFYDLLNYIHPFREGNGRTQRTFWARVAFSAGWVLNWAPIHGEELNEASQAARENEDLDQYARR